MKKMTQKQWSEETWKVALYCACGTGAEGEIPARAKDRFVSVWESMHRGEGHRPCTKKEAQDALAASGAPKARLTIEGKDPAP